MPTSVRLTACNASFCIDVVLIGRNEAVHGLIPICQHFIQNELDTLRRCDILLSLVVDNGIQSRFDLLIGKTVIVQKGGNALTCAALRSGVRLTCICIALFDDLSALFHDRQFIQQGSCGLLVIRLNFRVVVLKRLDSAVTHLVAASLVDVLCRVHLVHFSACVHADVAAIRKRGELLIGQFRLVNTLSAGKQFQKRVHICACISAGRCYTGSILLRG